MSEHTMGYLVGVGSAVLLGLIVAAVILKVTKSDGSMKCKFDERQAMARGKGFKYGYISLIICNALFALLSSGEWKLPVETDMAFLMSILISVLLTTSYLIWNDAYFALNERRPRLMVAFALIAAMNLWLGISSILEGRAIRDGVLTSRGINLLCGIMFVVIFIVLLAKHIRESLRVPEEEE